MIIAFIKVGGYAAIWELYPHSSPNTTRLAEVQYTSVHVLLSSYIRVANTILLISKNVFLIY